MKKEHSQKADFRCPMGVDKLAQPSADFNFVDTVGRARAHSAQREITNEPPTAPPSQINRFIVKSNNRIRFVNVDDVDWIKSDSNYVELHVGKIVHLIRETMHNLDQQLPSNRFLRISRSSMVNLDAVQEIQRRAKGDYYVILKSGQKVVMTRRFKDVQHTIRFG